MSRDKRRRKGSRGLVIFAVVIGMLLLAEGGLVAAVFLVPGTTQTLREVAADAERAWTGTPDSPGIASRVSRAVGGAYRDWVASLWSLPRDEREAGTFERCVSCHPDYATKRRFSTIYMDHPTHAQLAVSCRTCHTDTTHPDPLPVAERVCSSCHREVNEAGQCGLCHPPASLPHFYLLGAPREGPVACDSCHRKAAFEQTTATHPLVHRRDLSGAHRQLCLSCHEVSTCQECHAERHPEGWQATHGNAVAYGGQVTCYSCHTSTWCADRCHSATPTNPAGFRPPPSGGGS